MADADTRDIPLACSLSPTELGERSRENAALFARSHAVNELPDGYRWTFAAGEAPDLLEFILAERDCCPFFTFELTFPAPHQAVLLTVRGREGVKDILRPLL